MGWPNACLRGCETEREDESKTWPEDRQEAARHGQLGMGWPDDVYCVRRWEIERGCEVRKGIDQRIDKRRQNSQRQRWVVQRT